MGSDEGMLGSCQQGAHVRRCRHSGEARVWTRERNRAWPLDLQDKTFLRTPHSFAHSPCGQQCRHRLLARAVSQALSSLASSHLSQEEEEGAG